MQRLLWSSLQSAVFNAVLDARVPTARGRTALEGDLLKLRSSGGLFVCADVQTDRARAATGEVSPTGPIVGARMRWPEGARRGARATQSPTQILGEDVRPRAAPDALGEGTRRALRLWVEDLRWETVEADADASRGSAAACMRVYFVLPKGAYATTVLGTAVALDEVAADGGAARRRQRKQTEPTT